MAHNVNWDVNKYKEEHESEDQWQLRKAFLLKWKDHYPEERLVCLARVFTNIEFMGCRYPSEVMREVARLSVDVAKQYRNNKKTKLQRTFVSASSAAEDRARGVKRQGGVIIESPESKSARITFIPQGQMFCSENNDEKPDQAASIDKLLQHISRNLPRNNIAVQSKNPIKDMLDNSANEFKPTNGFPDVKRINYFEDMSNMACLDPRKFNERMFHTPYGQFVLVIRLWTDMINNLISTCAALKIPFNQEYKNGTYTLTLNDQVLATAVGDKVSARAEVCKIAWDKLRQSALILVLKEQWTPQNESRISMNDMSDRQLELGEPVEDSVALKMMKLMGWKGGGLGAGNNGIAEPIKPHFRMVKRAGLGHEASANMAQLKRAGMALMARRGLALDADLVFASDFTAEERAVLHNCANICGLMSKSYGKGEDRFLVVTNKLRPFSLVRAVVDNGGETPKYRVYIPATFADPEACKRLHPTRK